MAVTAVMAVMRTTTTEGAAAAAATAHAAALALAEIAAQSKRFRAQRQILLKSISRRTVSYFHTKYKNKNDGT
jgi:cysteine sulfinate desulfinase/cysteine desulfurase-like protein